MVLSIRHDETRPGGGYAVLEGDGLDGVTAISIESTYSGLYLGEDGTWSKVRALLPVAAMPGRAGSLSLGPRIVDAIATDTPLVLHGASGAEIGGVFWTDIIPTRAGLGHGQAPVVAPAPAPPLPPATREPKPSPEPEPPAPPPPPPPPPPRPRELPPPPPPVVARPTSRLPWILGLSALTAIGLVVVLALILARPKPVEETPPSPPAPAPQPAPEPAPPSAPEPVPPPAPQPVPTPAPAPGLEPPSGPLPSPPPPEPAPPSEQPSAPPPTSDDVPGIVPRDGQQPSFTCQDGLREPIAKLICADAELAEADGELGRTFRQRLAEADPGDKRALQMLERAWMAARNEQCGIPTSGGYDLRDLAPYKACLLRMTKQRTGRLQR